MGEAVRRGGIVIVVTGIIRSGTTPLSMMLHNLGVSMGGYMRFPTQNPLSHMEWEDAQIADPLMLHMLDEEKALDVEACLEGYIRLRRQQADGEPWGVKTPYLLPFVGELRQACDRLSEKLTLIVTSRDVDAAAESIHRQLSHIPVRKQGASVRQVFCLQKMLRKAWRRGSEGAEIFDHKDTHEQPREVARRLALLAGVEPYIAAAMRGIHEGER